MIRLLAPGLLLAVAALSAPASAQRAPAASPALSGPAGLPAFVPSDIPARFNPPDRRDYLQSTHMIRMRDGARLNTVVLRRKDARLPAPIMLTRTPYNAAARARAGDSTSLAGAFGGRYEELIEAGYILVIQDVRGKWGSEGDYIVNRPLRGPLNPTRVDHATDTWDTIDWLVKNVPGNNGRVGMIGVSYDGFTVLMGLVDPHPALKAAVPIDPMVDGWVGDDWFHNGAFRAWGVSWIFEQVGDRKNAQTFLYSARDDYDFYLRAGSVGDMGRKLGLDQIGFWRKLEANQAYTPFWQLQAMDRVLASRPLAVPTLIVNGWFDQEDIYGGRAVFRALDPKDTGGDRVFIAMGPWWHGQSTRDGSSIGALRWGQDTAAHFRREILMPFLESHLREGAPRADTPNVYAFETGTNRWLRLPAWPMSCTQGCPHPTRPLYLKPGGALGFEPATSGAPAEYTADPARPVPYVQRPVDPQNVMQWREWLLSDQRHAASRPDVLVFETAPLREPVRIQGEPVANLRLTTTGQDGDFVVKLIDVFPDEVPSQPELGGYQLMVSADIMRARYREDRSRAVPMVPGEPTTIRFALPHAAHVFRPGHRIQVQVQSSWFPLYDRNPQSWVESIFNAPASAYRPATIRVETTGGSFVELPVVPLAP